MERALQRVVDVLKAIENLEFIAENISFSEFENDRVKRAAFERFVEILSEASRNVPEELKLLDPQIPWQRIAHIGNHLRHAYHQTDPEILWNLLAHRHLAELKRCCTEFLRSKDLFPT